MSEAEHAADRPRATMIPAAEALRDFGRPVPPRPVAPPTLAETLLKAASVGLRFDLDTEWKGSPEDRIFAAELSDAQMEHGVRLRGAGLGTSDEKIAANMWFQWYCYRMAAPLLGAWLFHRRVPDVSAANIAFSYDEEGRPVTAALLQMRAYGLEGDRCADAELIAVPDLLPQIRKVLLEDHLFPLAERVRVRYRLGMPIMRGTMASQIGMSLTAIDANCAVPWEQVATDTLAVLGFTQADLKGLDKSGDIIFKESQGRRGMTYRRGTCCLVYQIPEKAKCGGCPLRDNDDRAGVYAERLANRADGVCV